MNDPVFISLRRETQDLMEDFISKALEDAKITPAENSYGDTSIAKGDVEKLTNITVQFVAELIQRFIDAGSEREVTYENEELEIALNNEFNQWVDPELTVIA